MDNYLEKVTTDTYRILGKIHDHYVKIRCNYEECVNSCNQFNFKEADKYSSCIQKCKENKDEEDRYLEHCFRKVQEVTNTCEGLCSDALNQCRKGPQKLIPYYCPEMYNKCMKQCDVTFIKNFRAVADHLVERVQKAK